MDESAHLAVLRHRSRAARRALLRSAADGLAAMSVTMEWFGYERRCDPPGGRRRAVTVRSAEQVIELLSS